MYNRGMLTLIIASCASVFIFTKLNGVLSYKTLVVLSLVGIIFLYAFGIFGNIRSNKQRDVSNRYLNSDYIMMVGDASDNFRDSYIPKPFFWGYIYISSPLANLQETMNYDYENGINSNSILKFINSSIIPDFISKRIDAMAGLEYEAPKRITPELTVSTLYSPAYLELGWLGMVLLYLFFMTVVIIYRVLLDEGSSFFISGIAILNTITMFNFFNNMFVFTGLSFQLVYPIILGILYERGYFKKLKIRINRLIGNLSTQDDIQED
jgi:hypothetical protein